VDGRDIAGSDRSESGSPVLVGGVYNQNGRDGRKKNQRGSVEGLCSLPFLPAYANSRRRIENISRTI